MERAKTAGPSRRVLVEWHPRLPDLFMAGGDELQLYEMKRHDTADVLDGSPSHRTVPRVYNRLKAVPVQQLTCMQAYPHEQSPFLMAAGTLHGRVQIINFKLPPTGGIEPTFRRNGSGSGQGVPSAMEGLAEARSGVVQTFYPKANRQCTAVAWNPHSPSQIAVGLEKGRSDLSIHIYDLHSHESERITPGGLYGAGRGGLGGEGLPIKPLLSFVPNEGVTALAWKTNVPHLLVYGTAARWLRVHDLRGSGPQTVVSITAHTKAVQGLALDPWNADVVATYSDNPLEPIKIWDLRKVDPSEPVVSIKLPPSKRTVAGVAWSPVRMGVLAVTHADDPGIGLYDVREANSGQVLSSPSHTYLASAPVMSLSWQARTATRRPSLSEQASWEEVVDRAVPNRLLVATRQGFEEMSMHDYRALHISRNGDLLLGCGRLLLAYPLSSHGRSDAAVVMQERIRAGYSMDVGRNLQVMTDELDAHPHDPELQRLIRVWSWVDRIEDCCSTAEQQLQQQAEGGGASSSSSGLEWPITGLGEAGVLGVFDGSNGEEGSSSVHEVLGCAIYTSRGRRVALQACGWSSSDEAEAAGLIDDTAGGGAVAGDMSRPGLARIMEECEALSHYERSAALAVFHGDLRAAVQALRRGAEALLLSARAHEMEDMEMMEAKFGRSVEAMSVVEGGSAESASYAELLQLVAMCIAGYVPPGSGNKGASGLWRDMCQALLDRPAMQARTSVSYLRAACSFLASISEQAAPSSSSSSSSATTISPDRASTAASRRTSATPVSSGPSLSDLPYRRVLLDPSISLADRTALACQFLPSRQLQAFLRQQGAVCLEEGNLEGVQLFGLGPQGIQLLQAYIDRTGDVQTAALLVSRIIVAPDSPQSQQRLVQEWIETYRDLLNGARMWHERAVMDVGRAQLLSELYKRQAASTGQQQQPGRGGERQDGPSPTPPSVPAGLPSVPPQLFVRCHYCSTAIQLNSLRRQGRMGQSWLSRQKPLLNCCPECRKPLPRCYICLLPLGCLNPYLELKRLMQLHPSSMHAPADNRDGPGGSGAAAAGDALDHDSMASLGGLRFPEWFTWCQNCKHGGHAHHILDWFETHDECGVSGCTCRCYAQDSALLSSAPQTADLATTAAAAPSGQGLVMPSPPLTTTSLAPFAGSVGKSGGGRIWDR